jgi:hypothetical protein
MRYEIDVAREARDVYKGQRDSLRDDIAQLKSSCQCGGASTIKRTPSTSVGIASASRPTTVKSSAALSPPPQSYPAPAAVSTISPRRGRSPPPMSFVNASSSAPNAPAPIGSAGGLFNASAPPNSRQYVELDAIEMPGELAMPSYDFVPPSRGDSSDGGGADPGSARYALGVQRSAPPVPMHAPNSAMTSIDDGNYRPLPMPSRAPAVYVPVPLGSNPKREN